jgi:Abi-like protein
MCGEATVIGSQGSQREDSATIRDRQELFSLIPSALSEIQTTLSPIRFNRYLTACRGDARKALFLYRWNSFLSQSLYWPSQTLEVAVRNSISRVLADRYGSAWHRSGKFFRQLGREDQAKLQETHDRQQRERDTRNLSADMIIADLPFGFWTSMLSARYEIPLVWRNNLRVAFPYLTSGLTLRSVYAPMDRIRILRNRIAHHEPIFARRLDFEHGEILKVIGWVCPATQWYVEQTTIFPEIWTACPT